MGDEELSPLDVLLGAMREHWDANRKTEAVALAKAAAPYVHAKPTGGASAKGLICALGDDELDELLRSDSEESTRPVEDQGEP